MARRRRGCQGDAIVVAALHHNAGTDAMISRENEALT